MITGQNFPCEWRGKKSFKTLLKNRKAKVTWVSIVVKLFITFFSCFTGPEEDLPRKMEYIEFVCHAPSDYYKCRTGPYLTISREPELCYIWTTMGEKIIPSLNTDELFGMKDCPTSKSLGSKFSKDDKKEKGHKKQDKEKQPPVEVKKEIIVDDS